MKKTSKRKKIIILIAIALIIVIIGIIIGFNVLKVNIANVKYNSANNDSSNGNLLPEYIKAGITLGGVTGTLEVLDTSDATATAYDILYGKTAYVDGKKIKGIKILESTELNLDKVYYADLTGDGTVDGVIYADLATGGSGKWSNVSWGIYAYDAITDVKEYYVIKEEYTDDFGTGEVIAPINGSKGKDRFYVMALDDVNPGTTYYWYNTAQDKLDKPIDGNYNDFGKGKENTAYVMEKWRNKKWGSQNGLDMWGAIEDKINAGWFVPSKSELAAFGDKLKITSSNYESKGISNSIWSSSQHNGTTYTAYAAGYNSGGISYDAVYRPTLCAIKHNFLIFTKYWIYAISI